MSDASALGPGGEFDVIRDLLAWWGTVAKGIGDDGALLTVPSGQRLVASTDVAIEEVHFRRDWLSAREIGWRATTAALSDLAAMGAAPLGVLIALVLTAEWRDRPALRALADGIADAVRAAGTQIVGGDLSAGRALAITVTVLGSVRIPLERRGARTGHAVYVTGRLGGPGLALEALSSHSVVPAAARQRFIHPVARIAEGRWLAEHGASSAIDISDGLLGDLSHIAHASGVRIGIELESLPLIEGAEPLGASRSGEEYELAVTAPTDIAVAEFETLFDCPLTRIGTVHRGPAGLDAHFRGARVAERGGYSHF
ncbi:MAG: thiamine-phosphate kinase [Gemmatimonadota bacterium]|nr:thiamine-phosphate kinase [Gemmatimonadota bacterium]